MPFLGKQEMYFKVAFAYWTYTVWKMNVQDCYSWRNILKNIKIVQAAWITRKVQEQNDRPWLEVIQEEVKKIKNERG